MMTIGVNANVLGSHVGEWRHELASARGCMNLADAVDLVAAAERGKLDFFFLADGNGVRQMDRPELFATTTPSDRPSVFEPITLLSALSMASRHIGLIATATTTYDEPYHVARRFGSLDHLSGGRAGWNVVTSSHDLDALNFSRDEHPGRVDRYRRALEFVGLVKDLWDSWDDDAFIQDKRSGHYLDPAKVHVTAHRGENFAVQGPLNMARPPQGHPVIFSAGQSEGGRDLAARMSDCVFAGVNSKTEAQELYRDLKQRMAAYGRRPDKMRILPSLTMIVGRTEAEADALQQELEDLVPENVGIAYLGYLLDMDLSGFAGADPMPEVDLGKTGSTARRSIARMAESERLTVRQTYLRVVSQISGNTFKGDPIQIADRMEDWYRDGACDGFVISVPVMPAGIGTFVDLVVPELQRRGLFKTDYQGSTLRENLGLPRPANRFFAGAMAELVSMPS